jgi:antibiotic biosynthesis monooxygenase (ABM) superfamily enzyme
MAIKRVWHGWTTSENADKYQNLLHNEVFPGIEAKNIPGYRSIELFRRDMGDEVEFVTIMTFDSLQNVIDFQGVDYKKCYVPEAAQRVLKRWDLESTHYDLIETRNYLEKNTAI